MSEGRILDAAETKELGRKLLVDGHQVRFRLGGSSMFPYLMEGDIAITVRVPIEQLVLGQVIVFEQNGRWIAHRLMALDRTPEGSWMVAQGDSIVRPDKPIAEHDYVGIIVGFVRNGRSVEVADPRHRLYGKLFVKLRPVPQAVIRSFLKIYDRLKKKMVHRN